MRHDDAARLLHHLAHHRRRHQHLARARQGAVVEFHTLLAKTLSEHLSPAVQPSPDRLLADLQFDRNQFKRHPAEVVQHHRHPISLGKLVGGPAQASLILRGQRQLSKALIRKLADHFRVSPALFL